MIGITIHEFGHRLGNQMFQLAALVALAKNNNDDVAFPKWDYAQYFKGDFTPTDFKSKFQFKEYGVFEGKGFGYSPIPYTKGMSIYGYFQSEKHFISQEETIRDMFKPATKVMHIVYEKFIRVTNRIAWDASPTCAIHVRRGDYVKWPEHHPMVTKEWYWKAMDTFSENTQFFIFSDDLAWCIKNIQKPYIDTDGPRVTVVEGGTDIEDFFMQQLCGSHIIANSSFSWWAAWLNKDAKVIAPKMWFGPALIGYDTVDHIPVGWERM